jgi:hypothetical protein
MLAAHTEQPSPSAEGLPLPLVISLSAASAVPTDQTSEPSPTDRLRETPEGLLVEHIDAAEAEFL